MMHLAIIGSDNGSSPGRPQAIICIIWTFSFQENAFENVVWKMAAIFPNC